MLSLLHPDQDPADFERDLGTWTTLPEPYVGFLAFDDIGEPIGMIDARVRNYAEGAPKLAAPYVEDLWIEPASRGSGVARALLGAVEAWAREQGYDWLASDALIDNVDSHRWHAAVGFAEMERLVLFGKPLA